MNQDTLSHIKYNLLKNKSFVFPGLGEFTLKRVPAFFSENHSVLNPPLFEIVFSDKITNYNHLESEFDPDLNKISNSISNELLISKEIQIKFFGSFFLSDSKSITFSPDQSFIEYFNPGYEPIRNINQITKTFAPDYKEIHVVNTESLIYEKSSNDQIHDIKKVSISLWKWLLPLLILIAIVSCFLFCKRPLFDFDYFNFKPKSKAQTTKVIKQKNENIAENVNVTAQKLTEADSITLDRKLKNLPCAIITGSLKNSKNILRMKDRLEQLGYEIYTEDNDSTTRIGMRYDCSTTDVDTLLQRLRNEISIDAWVLK